MTGSAVVQRRQVKAMRHAAVYVLTETHYDDCGRAFESTVVGVYGNHVAGTRALLSRQVAACLDPGDTEYIDDWPSIYKVYKRVHTCSDGELFAACNKLSRAIYRFGHSEFRQRNSLHKQYMQQ